MREQFIEKNFADASRLVIIQANEIIDAYRAQGYVLTLRQLYYQFVARDLIANTQQSYKRLGSIVNDARLAGLIDWDAIEDRTRNLEQNAHWSSPADGIQALRNQYRIDMWSNQERRVEVWIEKEALIGVIEPVCKELDVAYFACRGYVSQSEQWRAYRRHQGQQDTVILHLGDHDPSGIDMTRDNQDRLTLMGGHGPSEVVRIALNMDQVEEFNPPPNPAKTTDSRFEGYVVQYGEESWELDALEPQFMDRLIREHVSEYRDDDLWSDREAQVEVEIATLDRILEELNGE
jgi:hypothetical protein